MKKEKDVGPDIHKDPPEICTVRNHANLEKLLSRIGLNQPLEHDSEYGQDVAYLAYLIKHLIEENSILKEKLGDPNRKGKIIQISSSASQFGPYLYALDDLGNVYVRVWGNSMDDGGRWKKMESK